MNNCVLTQHNKDSFLLFFMVLKNSLLKNKFSKKYHEKTTRITPTKSRFNSANALTADQS